MVDVFDELFCHIGKVVFSIWELGVYIWPVLSLVVGALLPTLWRMFVFAPTLRSTFGFNPADDKTVIVPTIGLDEERETETLEKYGAPSEGVMCPDKILRVFDGAANQGRRATIIMSDVSSPHLDPTGVSRHHVLIIGGPDHNGWAKNLLEKLGSQFGFNGKNLLFSGDEYQTQKSEDSSIEDYALLICTRNAENSDKRAFAVMGCTAVGTIGVANELEKGAFRKEIRSKSRTLFAPANLVLKYVDYLLEFFPFPIQKRKSWIARVSVRAERNMFGVYRYGSVKIEEIVAISTETTSVA